MIIINTYTGLEITIRYYLLKYLPQIFYPFILKYYYKKSIGYDLDISNLLRFSEKIQYLKLNNTDSIKTLLTDKLQAKEIIHKIIPELKITKVFQVADNFEDLDFSLCPDKFVIKTNHACKSHVLIWDKNNISSKEYKSYKKYYKKVLNINYAYWGCVELQYKNIVPKIYTEEYLEDAGEISMKEYEIYCFNGNPEFFKYIISKQNYTMEYDFFDKNGDKTNFNIINSTDNCPSPDKRQIEKIMYYAKILSDKFKFVRVDLFEINNELYFGELTFTPFSGFTKFNPDIFDLYYGNKLKL